MSGYLCHVRQVPERLDLARSAAALTITTFAGIALVFLTSVVVSRALGPEGKGVYDLMVATASLGGLALGLSLPAGITYAVARGTLSAASVAPGAIAISIAIGLGSFAILTAGREAAVAIATLAPDSGLLDAGLISALAAISALGAMLRAALAGGGRVVLGARLDVIGRGAALLATAALAPGATPVSLVLAVLIGGSIGAVAEATFLQPRGFPAVGAVRGLVTYSLRAHGANVIQFLNYRLDLFLVGFFRGPSEVGLYALAGTLGQLVWVVSGSVAGSLFPAVAADADPSRSPSLTAAAARLTTALSLAIAVTGALLAVPGLRIVYGPDFVPAVMPLLVLLPGIVSLVPTRVIAAYFAGIGRPNLNLIISALSFVATVGLDLALIPSHGMVGAAVASTASYVVGSVAGLVMFQTVSGVPAYRAVVPGRSDLLLLAEAIRIGGHKGRDR